MTEVIGICNKTNIDISQSPIEPNHVAKLISYVDDGKISSKQAKDILSDIWEGKSNIDEIIKEKNIEQIYDVDQLSNE